MTLFQDRKCTAASAFKPHIRLVPACNSAAFCFDKPGSGRAYDVHALHGCRIGFPAQVVDGILGHLLRQDAKINIRPRFNNDGGR